MYYFLVTYLFFAQIFIILPFVFYILYFKKINYQQFKNITILIWKALSKMLI